MNPNAVIPLTQISVRPKRPPVLDPLLELVEPYMLAFGMTLFLGAIGATLFRTTHNRQKLLLALAGTIGILSILIGHAI